MRERREPRLAGAMGEEKWGWGGDKEQETGELRGSRGLSLSAFLSGGQGESGDGVYPQMRGHGKASLGASLSILILGRAPARED